MVNIGDILLVTLVVDAQSILSSLSGLQSKLQTMGFTVLGMDPSGLNYWSGQPGQLLVSVKPSISAYANQSDVASIVASAAYDNGFYISSYWSDVVKSEFRTDNNPGGTTQNIDYSRAPWIGEPALPPSQQPTSSFDYEQNLHSPQLVAPSGSSTNSISDALQSLGVGLGTGSVLTMAVIAVVAIVVLKR